jgi:ABC-type dipeptide/oligopeptide/nickel transport system permease subunit
MTAEATGEVITELRPHASEGKRFIRVFFGRGVVVFGIVVILILILVAIFAPLLAPYDPYKPELTATLAKPSAAHWLGTDALGRDTLSRIIYGSRTSLMIGLIVVAVASIAGVILGLSAGYFGLDEYYHHERT